VAVAANEPTASAIDESEGSETVELQLVLPHGIVERLPTAEERHGREGEGTPGT
jgi:hypothetical protein